MGHVQGDFEMHIKKTIAAVLMVASMGAMAQQPDPAANATMQALAEQRNRR